MLSAKAWYFTQFAAAACIYPYLNLYFRQLGFNEQQIGAFNALRPWVSAIAGNLFTLIADHVRAHRAILLIAFVLAAVVRFSIALVHNLTYLILLVVATEAINSPVGILVDASVMAACEQEGDYGKSRVWGAIGWGSFSALSGVFVTRYGIYAAFVANLIGAAIAFIPTCFIPVQALHRKQDMQRAAAAAAQAGSAAGVAGRKDYIPPLAALDEADPEGSNASEELIGVALDPQPGTGGGPAGSHEQDVEAGREQARSAGRVLSSRDGFPTSHRLTHVTRTASFGSLLLPAFMGSADALSQQASRSSSRRASQADSSTNRGNKLLTGDSTALTAGSVPTAWRQGPPSGPTPPVDCPAGSSSQPPKSLRRAAHGSRSYDPATFRAAMAGAASLAGDGAHPGDPAYPRRQSWHGHSMVHHRGTPQLGGLWWPSRRQSRQSAAGDLLDDISLRHVMEETLPVPMGPELQHFGVPTSLLALQQQQLEQWQHAQHAQQAPPASPPSPQLGASPGSERAALLAAPRPATEASGLVGLSPPTGSASAGAASADGAAGLDNDMAGQHGSDPAPEAGTAPAAAGERIGAWRGVGLVLSNPEALVFFVMSMLMGFGMGNIDGYLFLFLKDLGGSEALMGLTITFACIAEIPVFQCTGWLLRTLGVNPTLHLVLCIFVVRMLCYSLLPHAASPWMVLPVELLHGVTFACAWAAGTVNCSRISPPGLLASTQAIYQGLYMGVGTGVGGLVGGFVYRNYGAVNVFRVAAAVIGSGWMLCMLAQQAVWAHQRRQCRMAAGEEGAHAPLLSAQP